MTPETWHRIGRAVLGLAAFFSFIGVVSIAAAFLLASCAVEFPEDADGL